MPISFLYLLDAYDSQGLPHIENNPVLPDAEPVSAPALKGFDVSAVRPVRKGADGKNNVLLVLPVYPAKLLARPLRPFNFIHKENIG